jgi:hypothetical protein
VIERLCAERGEDFAGLSRMLGRNPAYIQQFVRRGVPKRLKEAERRKLARYFSISESLLGGPRRATAPTAISCPSSGFRFAHRREQGRSPPRRRASPISVSTGAG